MENRVDCGQLTKINLDKIKEIHVAKPGDLIFRSRGQLTTAAILKDDPGFSIVAAPLFRIRVTDENVIPDYLVWFINQLPAQTYLLSRAKGTALKMISKHAMENIEIELPPLNKQKKIVELAELSEKEQRLMNQLSKKRKQFVSTILLQQIKGD